MKLLAVFAHPDDESYGPAGTLARATQNGHEVVLLTMTHGESGSMGISKSLSREELSKRREQELRCAAQKLAIQQVKIQNLPDKHLQDIEDQVGINIIIGEIKRFKPDVIITFHENGISGHTDHKTVTRWTLNAVKSFPNPAISLCYGLSQEQVKKVTFRKLLSIENREITHIIDVGNFINNKIEAIKCHHTQITLWQQFQNLKIDFKILSDREYFVQKWPKPEKPDIKHDLLNP